MCSSVPRPRPPPGCLRPTPPMLPTLCIAKPLSTLVQPQHRGHATICRAAHPSPGSRCPRAPAPPLPSSSGEALEIIHLHECEANCQSPASAVFPFSLPGALPRWAARRCLQVPPPAQRAQQQRCAPCPWTAGSSARTAAPPSGRRGPGASSAASPAPCRAARPRCRALRSAAQHSRRAAWWHTERGAELRATGSSEVTCRQQPHAAYSCCELVASRETPCLLGPHQCSCHAPAQLAHARPAQLPACPCPLSPLPRPTVRVVGDELREVVAGHGQGGGVAARLQQLHQHPQQLAVVVHHPLAVLQPEGLLLQGTRAGARCAGGWWVTAHAKPRPVVQLPGRDDQIS